MTHQSSFVRQKQAERTEARRLMTLVVMTDEILIQLRAALDQWTLLGLPISKRQLHARYMRHATRSNARMPQGIARMIKEHMSGDDPDVGVMADVVLEVGGVEFGLEIGMNGRVLIDCFDRQNRFDLLFDMCMRTSSTPEDEARAVVRRFSKVVIEGAYA